MLFYTSDGDQWNHTCKILGFCHSICKHMAVGSMETVINCSLLSVRVHISDLPHLIIFVQVGRVGKRRRQRATPRPPRPMGRAGPMYPCLHLPCTRSLALKWTATPMIPTRVEGRCIILTHRSLTTNTNGNCGRKSQAKIPVWK